MGLRRSKFAVSAVILTLGVAFGVVFRGFIGGNRKAALVPTSVDSFLEERSLPRCGHVEANIDYVYDVLAGVGHVDNIASYQECCAICKSEPDCQAYTWVKDAKLLSGNPGQCWLKGGLLVSKAKKHGVYSALANKPKVRKTITTTEKPVLNLRAGDGEKKEMARLVDGLNDEDAKSDAKSDAKAAAAKNIAEDKKAAEAAAAKLKKAEEEKKAREIEEAEQRWAEKTLKLKAQKLAEKLAKENAKKELGKKAANEELAKNLAKEEAEEKKQPQMQKQEIEVPKKDDPYKNCAALGEGCLKSKCCKSPGTQCFTKNAWWAQCMPECSKGPNPSDQVSPMPWECQALGDRTPGEPQRCAVSGQNCMQSKCCMQGGTTCFAKNASYALCKASCAPGPDLRADDSAPWTCHKLGARTLGAAPWVATKCASNDQDCSSAACCKDPNHQCYRQDNFYSQCKVACMKGQKDHAWEKAWSCETVGSRTPAVANEAEESKGKVGKWVEKVCAKSGENCLESQCCQGVGHQCYTKNEYWAACKRSCSSGPDPKDNNATWDCQPRGPRSWGLAIKGYPSLYCITLFMPSSYEKGLLRYHLQVNGGIFACDGYNVYAAAECTLGTSKDGIEVKAIQIPPIKVGRSQDGTAGNAKLFMAVWDKVIAGGRFHNYDWTIKVDADAVMLPWRVRDHMRPHIGKKVYVVNCNKYPDSPNFPMMYGSMEIFSQPAMEAYAVNSWRCGKELPWALWGEDYFMTKCMDYVGVNRIADYGVIGDNVCTGANCKDTYTGAFHPFKSIDAWRKCWNDATSTGL